MTREEVILAVKDIISTIAPDEELDGLNPQLRSTMASGLVAEMEAPAAQVRRDILRRKAAAGGVRLPPECLDLLVDRVRGSVRDLESALIQLVATG